MVLALTGFAVVAGALLGFVNHVTLKPIEEANAKTLSEAIAKVVPGFDNNPAQKSDTLNLNGSRYIVYKAEKDGKFIGAAVSSTTNGFGGPLTVLVGFDPEGKIIDYYILSMSETPGLGTKADVWFKGGKGNIKGINPGEQPLTVSKDGGQVDAITASTITSRAFLLAVNNAYQAYKNGSVDSTTGATSKAEAASESDENVHVEPVKE